MKRLTLSAAVVLLLLFAAAADAAGPFVSAKPATRSVREVQIEEQYQPYEPIVLTVEREATVYDWIYPETVRAIELDNGRTLHVWAPPGEYRLRCAIWTIDWERHTVEKEISRVTFTVGEPEPPEPIENPYRPDPQLQKLVGPVSALKLSRSDASRLAKLFHDFGTSVKAGSAIRAAPRAFDSCQAFADELARRGAGLGLKGKYAGLATAVEGVLKSALGAAERPLDPAKAAAVCETLAWAVWETGKQG